MSNPGWETYFQPNERLLWEGAPLPGIFGKAKIAINAVFGLPFLVLGIAALISGILKMLGATETGRLGYGLFIATSSLPIIGIGAFLVVCPIVTSAKAHRKIRYALSTRCAYIAKANWRSSLECYPILPDTAIVLENGSGSDSVWFHIRQERNSNRGATTTHEGFENIADGDTVFRLIRQIQNGQI